VPAGAAPMPTRTAQAAPMAHPVYPQTHEEPTPPIGSPPSGNGDATPADRFVLPPDQAAALRAERGAAKLASSGARKPMLPLRTWVLLIITMLVTMCVLIFIVKKRRNQALMAQQTQQVQPPVLPPPTGPSPIQPPVPGTTLEPGPVNPPEPGAGPDEAPTANADAQGEQQPPPPAPAAGTQPDSVPAGPTPARGAADLVVARRYVDALPRYEELARQNPENTAYAAMVTVLRQKVRAMCHNGQLASGEPCPVQ